MAQTVKINGVTYDGVKEVKIPLATDGTKIAVYSDTSDANATADSIKAGATAYVGGEKITGNMPVNGEINATLDAENTSVNVPEGYTAGGTVEIVTETKSITPDKTAQSVTPTSGKVLTKVTVAAIPSQFIETADANAAAADIKKDKTAYVNGIKVTGTHTDASFTLENGVLTVI